MKENCDRYAVLITGLVDEELDEGDARTVRHHLDECPGCNAKFVTEKNIKRIVKEGITSNAAPAYLKTRIRHNLMRQGVRPGFWQLLRTVFTYRPVAAALAVSFIFAAIILPAIYLQWSNQAAHWLSRSGHNYVELRGEIICLDCECLQDQIKPTEKELMMHRFGIRTDDHSVWTFLYTSATKDLMGNHQMLKKRIAVTGRLFESSHYIQVNTYRLL